MLGFDSYDLHFYSYYKICWNNFKKRRTAAPTGLNTGAMARILQWTKPFAKAAKLLRGHSVQKTTG